MSTRRSHGLVWPECNGCGDELPAEGSFDDLVQAKKKAGWKTDKTENGYVDTCPACQKGSSKPEPPAAKRKDLI
jgi:hypothetical protein